MTAKYFEVRKPHGPFGVGYIITVDTDDPGYPVFEAYADQGIIADIDPGNEIAIAPDDETAATPDNEIAATPVANPARTKKAADGNSTD